MVSLYGFYKVMSPQMTQRQIKQRRILQQLVDEKKEGKQ